MNSRSSQKNAPPPEEIRGDMRMALQSPFWARVLDHVTSETTIWRRSLLTDPTLSPAETQGYVRALGAVRHALYRTYEDAGLEVPAALKLKLGEV